MALVTTDFNINITPGTMPPVVHVSEYDIGRSYTVGLIGENNDTFTIPTGTTATIEGTLNGVVGFSVPATISNNKVAFTLTESMTAYSGKAWCKIKLTLNDEPIQTCAFIIAVDRAGVESETVIGAPGFEEQIKYAVSEEIANLPTTGGQPKPVTSAEEMTDTTTIYLYLGSEDGYEYGYIYVYKDGTWVNTGLYGKGQDGESPEVDVAETAEGVTITVNGNSYTVKNGENGTATDEQVAAWLDAHPEATTTVQDGSITQAKMAFPAVEGQRSPNLIDPAGLISARFTSTSGARQTFSETQSYYNYWRMTDYIDVSAHVGEQVWVHNVQGYCFYDRNKTAIAESGFYQTSMLSDTAVMGVTIPDGSAYFVVAMRHADGRVYTANFGTELVAYVPYGQIDLKNNSITADKIADQLPLSKIDTSDFIMPKIGLNLIDKTKMVKDMEMGNSGNPSSTPASLQQWYVDGINVTSGKTYLAYCNEIVFFDSYGNVCGTDTGTGYRQVTAPLGAVTCAVNGSKYSDTLASMVHGEFLIEGNTLPDRVVNEKYIPVDDVENSGVYKSVLHRMADCWDYTTKTTIGLCGDSNTIGIKGNGNTTQNPNCWANLLTAEISKKLNGERYIFPFGDVGVWGCENYGTYGQEANLNTGAVIQIPFYGTSITMVPGSVKSVPVSFSVEIDGVAQEDVTIDVAADYTWGGLNDGPHTLTIVCTSGKNYCISRFAVQKTVEVINRGISGRNLGQIENDVGVSGDTIDIVCYGTNNRGTANALATDGDLTRWEYTNRKTKIIYLSPVPAWDDIETAGAEWGTVPYIESFIAGREAKKNCEYISLYHEIMDYCTMNGIDYKTLYVEGLHLNDAGHKVVARILCRKLGLGDLSE